MAGHPPQKPFRRPAGRLPTNALIFGLQDHRMMGFTADTSLLAGLSEVYPLKSCKTFGVGLLMLGLPVAEWCSTARQDPKESMAHLQ